MVTLLKLRTENRTELRVDWLGGVMSYTPRVQMMWRPGDA